MREGVGGVAMDWGNVGKCGQGEVFPPGHMQALRRSSWLAARGKRIVNSYTPLSSL